MGSFLSSMLGGSSPAEDSAASSEDSRVMSFHSSARWQLHFNSVKDTSKLLVIDFSASWCGPCRFIEPAIHAMADKFTDVDFAKIDVDELSDVSQEFGVQAMPTFVLLKNGKEVDRVVGAKKDELEKKVQKYRSL
ncbi:putative monodehydroascorbate reductase (NADH) [Rosa chinensis]|uniref:Putative monodehydroascorbate reductase (NADH) n=1 Tax=Rosa chinensis TaxID=74649 RepID=A0A2P6S4R8_ROSCH|nr:thioredoxin H2 [Rosa chinensis]PRQ53683.1 putative monodehydroascorbate reductase (NADH) [Rosa chinensis]